jgi:anaerobic selenocysteine-containing dehydrogenase
MSVMESASTVEAGEWKPTACILCECNCGIEVRLGEPVAPASRRFDRIRGDKAHPGSRGYTCEKALRLDHYQNGTAERLLSPLRRRADGTFEEITWETAIAEVAGRLSAIRDEHGGESILYYGGGGQGNHLGGGYSGATMRAFGSRFRSNALAQEKTGEFWVNGRMLGAMVRGDFEHAEVALFVGKNPWHSHGMAHARTTLKAIANDPARSMIVIDPRRTETAELADIHLQVRPGRDAWLLGAIAGIIAQERLYASDWLSAHAVGVDEIVAVLNGVPVANWCAVAGVDEALVRRAVRRIAAADSVAVFEDLGVQQNRHSTLVSYLEKLVWLLTGNFGKPGTQFVPSSMVSLARPHPRELAPGGPVSPVTGSRIISGLIPSNVVAEEILSDHPKRFRALFVESSNPLHSLADSRQMRAAVERLELLVVLDVAFTETARQADYVLPVPTQFEKFEATFFNFEFPHNVFHLRRPVVQAPDGPLPEPEIHARLAEAAGALPPARIVPLRDAALRSRAEFAAAFFEATAADPTLGALAPLVLYRTLGPALDVEHGTGAASAALLWGASHRCALSNPDGVRRAGYGVGLEAGERLFDAVMSHPSGVVITDDEYDVAWQRIGTPDGAIQLVIPELLAEFAALSTATAPGDDPEWPFLLSAGERRAFTANTIIRDPAWRKRDRGGALRVGSADAERLGLVTGDHARLTTPSATAVVVVDVDDAMQTGHLSIPNGLGLDEPSAPDGELVRTGVAPNEFTAAADRDALAGTPWHKSVPARLEPVPF